MLKAKKAMIVVMTLYYSMPVIVCRLDYCVSAAQVLTGSS